MKRNIRAALAPISQGRAWKRKRNATRHALFFLLFLFFFFFFLSFLFLFFISSVAAEQSRAGVVLTRRRGYDRGKTIQRGKLSRPPTAGFSAEPIPSVLCVNTESLAAIKAIPTRYLTAFKGGSGTPLPSTSLSAPSATEHRRLSLLPLSLSLSNVVFHFPPFHIDFRGTMKFQRGTVAQPAVATDDDGGWWKNERWMERERATSDSLEN